MYGRGQSNLAHDFNAYDSTGKIWHIGSSTFVTEAVADYVSYRIPAVKGSDANDALIDAPFSATAPTGTVRYVLRERGASLALSYEVWEGDLSNDAAEILTAFKADPQLGTADGGLVANAAQVLNLPRGTNPVAAGATVTESWTKIADSKNVLVIEKGVS